MNAAFSTLDSLNLKLDEQSQDLVKSLEHEFIQLKYKSARCARACFSRNLPLTSNLNCERECKQGIDHMKNFISGNFSNLSVNFERCLMSIQRSLDGQDEQIKDIESGVRICYEQLQSELPMRHSKILEEFSYYQ
jgi:hypothetical protein